MICVSAGSKSRLAKAAGAEAAAQSRHEKLHAAVWREARFQVKMYKTPCLDHLKFRCRKSARRCSAKHICNSKCQKTDGPGALLEAQMSRNCTPL